MGSTYGYGMQEAIEEGWISPRQAVSAHLTSNHYPPVPSDFTDTAVKAIELANEGQWDTDLVLPLHESGGQWTIDGAESLTVAEAVEAWHLHAFLESPEVYSWNPDRICSHVSF